MLCKRSAFFKNRFQRARKDIEGECVICHEDLDTLTANLTYCKACGNNLHQDCMNIWHDTNSTCPTCRAEWVASEFFESMHLEHVDANGFDVYIQWLYGSGLPTYNADKGDDELRCIRLIDAHIVGDFVKDSSFVQAVRQEIIVYTLNVSDVSRNNLTVRVYANTNGACALRKCFIDLCILKGKDMMSLLHGNPADIVQDLFARLLQRTKARSDKDIWTFMSAAGHIEQDEANNEAENEEENETRIEKLDS